MESKMLDEIKPEVKPENSEPEVARSDRHPTAPPVERRQPAVTLPPVPSKASTINDTSNAQIQKGFYWEQIGEDLFLPYIKRETENYVAHYIVAELVYNRIKQVFSQEMPNCVTVLMVKMSQQEADTFNEINLEHCDKSVAGDHCFEANEFMMKLEHVSKLMEFYTACKGLLMSKKDNNLFGYIRIANKNQVPFVWDCDRKLVPLFYFEGTSEYLDARSVELTDPFKIGYLKFCCKIQKIRKDIYEQNPLRVVDFEDIKKLFPADTAFEVSLPEILNQELLCPKLRDSVLRERERRASLQPNGVSNQVESAVATSNSSNEQYFNDNDEFLRFLLHGSSRKPVKRPAQRDNVPAKVPKTGTTHTTIPQNLNVVANQPFQPPSGAGVQRTNPVYFPNYLGQPNHPTRISEVATASPIPPRINNEFSTTRPPSNGQITNVPYASPRGASSPDYPNINPFMYEAVQRPQVTITPVTSPQSTVPTSEHYLQTHVTITPIPDKRIPQQTYAPPTSRSGSKTNQSQRKRAPNKAKHSQPVGYASIPENRGVYTNNLGAPPPYVPAGYPHQRQSVIRSSQQLSGYNVYEYLTMFDAAQHPPHNSRGQHQGRVSNILDNRIPPIPNQNWRNPATQRMPQPNAFMHSAQVQKHWMNQPQGFPSGTTNLYQNCQNPPPPAHQASHPLPTVAPVILNSYVSVTNNVLQTGSHTYTSNVPSLQCHDVNNNASGTPGAVKLTVTEPPQSTDANSSSVYQTTELPVTNKKLLSISQSPGSSTYLVNLSEFVEKVLGLNPFVKYPELLKKFSILYELNSCHKEQWDRVAREKKLEFVGPLKEIFVNYHEIMAYLR